MSKELVASRPVIPQLPQRLDANHEGSAGPEDNFFPPQGIRGALRHAAGEVAPDVKEFGTETAKPLIIELGRDALKGAGSEIGVLTPSHDVSPVGILNVIARVAQSPDRKKEIKRISLEAARGASRGVITAAIRRKDDLVEAGHRTASIAHRFGKEYQTSRRAQKDTL